MLGFHSDPTKSTQFSPQIGGGNGRNVNYQIDGGDNNDDTVGGLLQLFPLEAIQEFQFVTSRYKAEYGRSNGGVMNIVTKSGTNSLRGSWFTMLRDDSMNAATETEKRAAAAAGRDVTKQDYRRYQYGGSVGGPILRDRAHFFGAIERTQQDTFQVVNTQGLFPEFDGAAADAVSREPRDRQGDLQPHAVAVPRGALRTEHQLAALRRACAVGAEQLGHEHERVQLDQPQPQLGDRRRQAERVHLPVRRLRQRDHGQQQGRDAHVPEQRPHRAERQHAAVHAAAQVAVPR